MNNSYIILNRKPSFIIKFFTFNIIILIGTIIWGINTIYYQSYINFHSKLLIHNSKNIIEILVPVDKLNQIKNQNEIIIDSKKYNYKIYKLDNNATYINQKNYQKVFLEIFNLNEFHKINGYEMDVKIPEEKKKIVEYLKNEKEE